MTTARILLHPRRAKPFYARHPWVFAGAIAGMEGTPADGGVVETPFALPGMPRRIEGREAFAASATAARAALVEHVRFTAVRNVVIHETTDPELAVVEYEVEAVRLADGLRTAAPFAVVVRVHDGRIVLWREYQDPSAMALAAAQ